MSEKMIVTVRGVPLEVEFVRNNIDGVVLQEIWICGIEMLVLLDDRFLGQIRDEVQRKLSHA